MSTLIWIQVEQCIRQPYLFQFSDSIFSSMSTVSYQDEPAQEDMKSHVKLENTYQLSAQKKFPDSAVESIIRDVLEGYLVDQPYEPEICRQMTKTLSEVYIHISTTCIV